MTKPREWSYPDTDRDAGPLFRASDPVTSVEAGREARSSGLVSDHGKRILRALSLGAAGKSVIGQRAGLTEQQVARRMAELERGGWVARTGRSVLSETNHRETLWTLGPKACQGVR